MYNTTQNPTRQQTYTDIDAFKDLIFRLGDLEQRILGLLLTIRSKSRYVYPSLDTIASETNSSRRTSARKKSIMEGLGLFSSRQRGKNTSCIYYLHRFFDDSRMKDTIEWLIQKFNNTPEKVGTLVSIFKCDYSRIIRLSSNKMVDDLKKASIFLRAKLWDSEFIDNLVSGWKSFTGILPSFLSKPHHNSNITQDKEQGTTYTPHVPAAPQEIRIHPWEQDNVNLSQLFYKEERKRMQEEHLQKERMKLDKILSQKTECCEVQPAGSFLDFWFKKRSIIS